MIPQNALRWGRLGAPPPSLQLQAGPLTAVFDPETAFLRRIRFGEHEVLRAVYMAVRDCHWRTVVPRITRLVHESGDRQFILEFEVECREREIDFAWHGHIEGCREGMITFMMEGEARSVFLRNRIGFCVLHPIRECAGRPCTIERTDASRIAGTFPDRISPHQPFKDVRAIIHEVLPGLRVEVRCEGDTFEMEDQRNWSDASFKTYCTPLDLPFPVRVEAGTRISQRITLRLHGAREAQLRPGWADSPVIRVATAGQRPVRIPAIGLGARFTAEPPGERTIRWLKGLNLSHLRADLHPSAPDFARHLRHCHDLASRIGVPLEAALRLSEPIDEDLTAVASEISLLEARVSRWLIFRGKEKSTSAQSVQAAGRMLSETAPQATFCGGTDGYFVEVNRNHPPLTELDEVCYSLIPQVHAFDNTTLIENLIAQSWTVLNAREICGGLPIVISPVTLRSRKHKDLSEPQGGEAKLPDGVDPRQMSLFGAGWTLGSLKYLSESGVKSATYFEAIGWRGVMETEYGSPMPDLFPSIPGSVYPLYHVLADFGEFAGGEVVPSLSSAPERVECMVLRKGGAVRTMLANLGSSTESVQVAVPELGQEVRLRVIDERNAEEAMRNPESFRAKQSISGTSDHGVIELCLLPCAFACIDSTSR